MRAASTAAGALIAVLAGCAISTESPLELGSRQSGLVLGTVHWEQPTAALPPARMGHALIYDSARGVTLAVGGRPISDIGSSISDTWAWDGSAWTELAAGFPARGFVQGAFDPVRQVSVIYGGIDQSPSSTYFAETWERAADTWSNRAGTPAARSSSGIAFDSARGVTLMFGGFDGTWRNDLWEWNGSAWTQLCTTAPCNTSLPPRRAGMVLAYDAARQETLLYGGYDSTGSDVFLGDTWTWNGTSWTQHTPPTAPSARVSAAAAYDPVTQLVYLFGGANGTRELGDLWVWDGSAWQQVPLTGAPSARRDARLVWDGARRRGVLFGGRSGTESVDFWELSLVGNECTTSDTCHTGVCDGSICVEPDAAGDADAGLSGSAGAGGAGPGGGAGGTGEVAPSAGSGGRGDDAGSDPAGADAGLGGASPETPLDEQRERGDESLYGCTLQRGAPRDRTTAAGLALLALAVLGRVRGAKVRRG